MKKLLRRRYSVATWIPVGVAALAALTMAANRGMARLGRALYEPGDPHYFVNAGDCGAVDWSDLTWESDRSFDEEWGFVGDRASGSWDDLNVDDVYRCASQGQSFGYQFTLPNGEYSVKLYFLEPELEVGARLFDVRIEGEKVLEGFDIAAEAGGKATSIERGFVANVEDGRMEIEFEGSEPGALVSAIAVEGLSLAEPPDAPTEESVEEPPASENVEASEETGGDDPGEVPVEDPEVETDEPVVDEQPAESEQNPPASEEPTAEPVDEGDIPFNALTSYQQYVNVGRCDPVEWDGVTWAADQAYSPGSWGYVGENYSPWGPGYAQVSDATGNMYGDDGQYLHRCRAYGTSFGHRFDLPNGEYDLRLRFVEPLRDPGQRHFDVLVEDQLALDDFDIAAEAGGVGIAKEVTFLVTIADGQLAIDFVGKQPGSFDPNAIVQAIAVSSHQEVVDESVEAPTPTAEPTAEEESQPPAESGPSAEGEQPAEGEQNPSAGEEPPAEPEAGGVAADPGGTTEGSWYVNAGTCGDVQWMDHLWLGDQPYAAGSWGHLGSDYQAVADDLADPVFDETHTLYGAEGQYLHRCQVYGQDFGYQFDLPDGDYEIHLRFAEPLHEAGERWFDVVIEGMVALDDFDVSQAAGGQDTAVERAFIVKVADGQLRIDFVGGQDGSPDPNAMLQAISVIPAQSAGEPTPDPATPDPVASDTVTPEPAASSPDDYQTEDPALDPSGETPVTETEEQPVAFQPYVQYVNAGRCGAVTWEGVTWAADQTYAHNSWGRVGRYRLQADWGVRFSDSSGVRYSGDAQTLHRCRVQGRNFGYRFDVPNGTYRVQLRFAEPNLGPGRRWFDVAIEDQVVLDNFDIAAEAGRRRTAVERTFEVEVTDGQLAIDFRGWQPGSYARQALVQALGVVELVPGVDPTEYIDPPAGDGQQLTDPITPDAPTPTPTALPTSTPVPTSTPLPPATVEPEPSATPVPDLPTPTPEPTSTPLPTPTSGPEQPAVSQMITYPQEPGAQASSVYSMTVNGQPVFVEKWNDVSFTRFAFTGQVEVQITVSQPVSSYRLSPTAFNISSSASGRTITFTLDSPRKLVLWEVNGVSEKLFIFADPPESAPPQLGEAGVVDVSDYGSGTSAIQQAIDQTAAQGGVLYFPPGAYQVDTINLRSNVTLYLAGGARLSAQWIWLSGARNVTIRGRGTISNHNMWAINGGHDSLIEDVVLLPRSGFGLYFNLVDNLTVYNVKIIGWYGQNGSDGSDFAQARGLTFDNNFVYSGDDAISFGSFSETGAPARDVYDINVRNNVFMASELGSAQNIGTAGDTDEMRDFTFENNYVVLANTAILLLPMDRATYRNLYYKNIFVEQVHWKLLWFRVEPWNSSFLPVGNVRDVHIVNLVAEANGPEPSEMDGYDASHTIENVAFENLVIGGQPITSAAQGNIRMDQYTRNVTFSAGEVPVVGIWASSQAVEGTGQAGRFTISRSGPVDQPLTVSYTIRGSAANGRDYESLPGSVTIPAGEASTTLTVQPLADDDEEGFETVQIALDNHPHSLDGYLLGPNFQAVLAIVE